MPFHVAFLGTKSVGFECLKNLIENEQLWGVKTVAVITSPNERFPGKDPGLLAGANGIPVHDSVDALLLMDEVDFILSVQFNTILKPEHIKKARKLAVNLHMAPLPEYRGCNQFSYAILEGKNEFGTTLHRLEAGIDSGAIIAEKRFPIIEGTTAEDLYRHTETASIALFIDSIPDLFAGRISFTEQSILIPSRGTSLHYRKEINRLKIIDPTEPEEFISRRVRATSMPGFEPPHSVEHGEKVFYRLDSTGRPERFARGNFPRLRKTGLREVRFGKNVTLYEPANLYECTIGDNAVIGPYCEVQRGAIIGAHTKVQSHAFICELVEIGTHCFISHGVMFINDKFSGGGPAGGDRSKWRSTRIGNRVSIGSNATILPVTICDDVVIGAGSVVTKDIAEPGTYAGNPAKKLTK